MTSQQQEELNYETVKAIGMIYRILRKQDVFDQLGLEHLAIQVVELNKFTDPNPFPAAPALSVSE